MPVEKNIIGFDLSGEGKESFQSYNPATGANNEYNFVKATEDEVNKAAEIAP